MDRRAGFLVALLVAFAFAAGLMGGKGGAGLGPASLPAPAGDAPALPPRRASPAPTLSAPPMDARPTRPTGDAAASPATARESGPPEDQVVLEGLRPAVIRVHVVDADGKAVPGATLRAIPEEGALPGGDGAPDGETDALGRATVTVPGAGRYAVTALAGLRVALREGVVATERGQGEVEFVLGRMADFEVRRTGIAGRAGWLVLAVAPGPRLPDGTIVGAPLTRTVTTSDESILLSLPQGVPFTVHVQPNWGDPPWSGLVPAGPLSAEVSAPGSFMAEFRPRTVADDAPTTVRVQVEVGILAERGALPPWGRVGCAFRPRFPGSPPEESRGWVDWGPEDDAPSVCHAPSPWPPETPGRIEWTVGGVCGSVEVPPGRAGEEIRLTGTVRIPASAIETSVQAVEILDENGVTIPFGGPEETCADLFTRGEELGHTSAGDAESHVRNWLRDHVGQTLTAVRGNWRVSRPGSTTAEGTLRLRLELGGYLQVHLRTPLRRGLGRLVVERTDGGWLGTYTTESGLPHPEDDGESLVYGAEAVKNGTLLGPLPPGDVGLRFRLGGVEVGRTTAHVVAGEVSLLSIR